MKYLLWAIVISSITFFSCGDDEEPIAPAPDALMISGIQANGISFSDGSTLNSDLNGATSAGDVALDGTITIEFNKPVAAASATASNVTLASVTEEISASVSASGSQVILDPTEELARGTMYTLSISGLMATDGGSFSAVTRTFTTEGRASIVVPNSEALVAYWSFDGTTDDATGDFPSDNVVDVTFGNDRFGQGNSTASFDGDASVIEVPDGDRLMASEEITISFWVKTNSVDHVNQNGDPSSNFVFGLAAFAGFQFEIPGNFGSCKLAMSYVNEDGESLSEDLFFPGDGRDKDNDGWQGWDFVADLTGAGGVEALLKDQWAHIICTYDAESKSGKMYINGVLMKSQDFNLWPDEAPKKTITGISYNGDPSEFENILAFGFIKSIDSPRWIDTPWGDYFKPTANHFKGDLDDVRVFSTAFSAEDAASLYDSEKQ